MTIDTPIGTAPDALPKTFDPAAIEARWYAHWEDRGLFHPDRPDAQPFTIVNPPPNVTGSLHIGHALDNTLQDIVIRYERLRGKDALWVVGTDHAGIATQMVVERQMALHQQKRTDFTREAFIDKVWEWKEESGGEITRQLRRLGCSMDWANERFTMDEGFSKAVIKVFVELHRRGLLYRDKRLVNWDPGLKTAISDLEVETREIQGKFWHFRYPLADGVTLPDGRDYIVVATTRPETMLADMAVAVNGADARYASVIGQYVELPITGRRIRIVPDDHADPELGSGAVKITPGHDFNDFEVGKRAGFKAADMLNMFDADAKVVQVADSLIPDVYLGLDRFDARRQVVDAIAALGLLEKVEDRVIQTPYGDRSGVVIEPWLTDQWYVDAETLAKPAIEAVKSGKIEIVPKTWEKTYFNWMENIQPWCVSRQLWWGHRIPAWYAPKKTAAGQYVHAFVSSAETKQESTITRVQEPIVCESEDQLSDKLTALYGRYVDPGSIKIFNDRASMDAFMLEVEDDRLLHGDVLPVLRDSDVLDTWFSSALWPFGTLGWPEEKPLPFRGGVGLGAASGPGTAPPALASPNPSPEGEGSKVQRHYPNDLLISGFDILFFWDARMIMQGLEFMGEVPWRKLYLHGLVRAADGGKMSKSKGNTVDPLGLIDRYGADALRFFMAAMESQGRDIKMDEKRVEGYRNFATKLWNAARFLQSNGIGASSALGAPDADMPVNRWIIAETMATVQALDLAMADLRFDAAANAIYHFVWDRFCDWYLELIKGQIDAETKAVAGWVFDQILVMLHPFMPFVTEELWNAIGARETDLIVAQWPQADAHAIDTAASGEIDWLIRLIGEIRTGRNEVNVPPGARTNLIVLQEQQATTGSIVSAPPSDSVIARIRSLRTALHRLARINVVHFINSGLSIDLATGEETHRSDEDIPLAGRMQIVVDGTTFIILVGDVIDLSAESVRLTKARDAAARERDALEARLKNPSFVERAKPEAVTKAREDHAEKSAEAQRLSAALARLG